MSNNDYQAVQNSFIDDLRQALQAAGSPSYARLEQLSGYLLRQGQPGGIDLIVLARSTTQEILTGHRRQPLKWQWVISFVTTLHVAARRAGVDISGIGTVEEWKRKHDAVRAAMEPAGQSAVRVGNRQCNGTEKGSVLVPAAAVSPLARILAGADSGEDALRAQVFGMLRQAGAPQWWHGYRDVAPEWLEFYLYLESAAALIRTYETNVIPGLLQVETYARTIIKQGRPDAPAHEIARLVELRMRRRQLLYNERPCHLWAILEESALRNTRVGPRAMRAQIGHLIGIAEQPNVTIQVVPPAPKSNGTLSEPITIFRFPGEYLGDVVHLEEPGHPVFLHERKDTELYLRLYNSLAISVGDPQAARDLLWKISREM
jgi:Domain of unknown function (DUF5753)